MNYLMERVAYLKGLMDGLGVNDSTNEGKILKNVVDILDDFVDEIWELKASKVELDEYVQTIDEDLANVEDELYSDYDGDFEAYDGDDYHDTPQYIEVECPHCQETVYFADDLFDMDEDLLCPKCNVTIYREENHVDLDG